MATKEAVLSNYDIIKTLGEGAFGQALLAKDKKDGAKVVIKIVNLDSLDDEYEQKAINEGNVLRKVSREADHENVVKFYGSYLFDKEAVLIMEYVDGGDLKGKIEEARINQKKLEEKQIVTWVKEIASALRYCHKDKNIMHRDIKPDNILLTNDGHIKLADFGNSKMLSKKTKITKTRIGDLDYISPEIENGEEYTFSTDIWSLGVLTYELCLLQHPMTKYRLKKKKFLSEGGIPKLEDKDYSPELSDLIQKMLSFKPEERPTTDEIIQVCETLLARKKTGYQGDLVNGVRQGKGKYYFENGDKYEGDWKNNKMEGSGIYEYNDGDKYDGDWVAGKKQGKGTYTFAKGSKYVGEWVQGKMEGKGIFTFSNGDKYDGQWKNNKREGNGVYYYSNGNKYEGEWKDNQKEGKGTFYICKKGTWKNNEYQK